MKHVSQFLIAFLLLFSFNQIQAQDFKHIENRWKSDQYLHNQNGKIEAGKLGAPGWWSAQWEIVPVKGTNFVQIKNRWKSDQYLHNQNGKIEVGKLGAPGWWSAQWQIIPVRGTNFVQIRNRWKSDQYLHNQNGKIEVGKLGAPGWWSAQWNVKPPSTTPKPPTPKFANLDSKATYIITIPFNNKVLDIPSHSKNDGVQLHQWYRHNGTSQQFRVQPTSDGYYLIYNVNSGKVVDIYNGSKKDGEKVIQWGKHGGPNQQFGFIQTAPNTYIIMNRNSGKVLDVYGGSRENGGKITQYTRHGRENQLFKLVKITPKKPEIVKPIDRNLKGTYRIQVKATKRFLHENGLGDKLVSTRHQPTDDFTRFIFEPQEDGSYRLKVKANGRYLHEDGGTTKILSTRWQPTDDFTRFYFEPQGDGTYQIKVKATGKYLHEDGGGDKLISTRYQPNDDFTRFILVKDNGDSTPKPSNSCKAWVWYNNPTSKTAYQPDMSYQYNSEGGAIKGERINTGHYKVIFPGLGKFYSGVCHVSAYAGNHSAQVERWSKADNDLHVFIRTFDAKGTPVDGKFSAIFYKEDRKNVNAAYSWVNRAGSPNHAYRFNGKKGGINVVQKGTGMYQVIFEGIVPNNSGEKMTRGFEGFKGNVQVTTYGSEARRCRVVSWQNQGDKVVVNINSNDFNGQPASSKFVVSYSSDMTNESAFVWANNAKTTTTYAPSMAYQMNNASTTNNTIIRTGVGTYKVTLAGVKSSRTSNAIVTAYGSANSYATIGSWNGNNVVKGTDVVVRCYSPDGQPMDAQFSLIYNTDNANKTKATPLRKKPNSNNSRGRGRN